MIRRMYTRFDTHRFIDVNPGGWRVATSQILGRGSWGRVVGVVKYIILSFTGSMFKSGEF